jgi:protein SCO1/2
MVSRAVPLALMFMLSAPGCKSASGPPEPATTYSWNTLNDEWEWPAPIPAFRLTDQLGREFELSDFDQYYVLVGFVFSRCPQPEACPRSMQVMRKVQVAWEEAQRLGKTKNKNLWIMGVTLDPEFDKPAQLKRYGDSYEADWRSWSMVTGPGRLVAKELPLMFGVMAMPSPNPDAIIRHSVKMAVMRPGRHHFKEWIDNKVDPAAIVQAIIDDEG